MLFGKIETEPTYMSEVKEKTATGKHLVIVESPHKAQTIGKFLGSDYIVLSSKGHIRDLPARSIGIDIANGFTPQYEISESSKKVVATLKSAAKKATDILLASDPDREGEAIAWHLREVLAPVAKNKHFYRIQYNEITPRAVKAALANPSEINMPRVDAQQTRRLIDRIVGYKVSPFIWRNIKGGSSAGRVQSVALRLVCEREREIAAFNPVSYWIIGALLQKSPFEPFFAKLMRINGAKAEITSQEQSEKILSDLSSRKMVVETINTRELTKHALPPFITSSLQRAASSVLGFTPGRTMSIAQKLYEGIDIGGSEGPVGLITYMRTDAPAVARDAQEAALDFIGREYGASFVPNRPNVYKSGAKAQEAHEAIRPTDVTRTPASLANKLDPAELKLYDLIWRRFVSSQMADAKLSQRTVLFDAVAETLADNADKYTFSATTTEVVFQGFMKVMELDIRKLISSPDGKDSETAPEEDTDDVVKIPELTTGEAININEIKSDRKETKPPARYSEAMLIDALEKNGIGRPSTYASIMDNIIKHEYVTRERRTLFPTELGMQVVDILVNKLPSLFDVGFTAEMETDLDKIESGSIKWDKLMNEFYTKFTNWMEDTKDPPADINSVEKLLTLLKDIKEWLPAEKRGRRVYDDKKLADSISEQFDAKEKPISKRQLSALAAMAWRYRAQLNDVEALLKELELDEVIKSENPQTPSETLEKLDLLLAMELTESQQRFIASLARQAKSGRNLSPRQVAAVDQAFIRNLPNMANKDELAQKFNLQIEEEAIEADNESPTLLAALAKITEWREPVKRGKRVFDDSDFYKSVKKQFEERGSLSVKQRAAMRNLIGKYRSQIPEADELAPKAKTEEVK